MESKSRKGGKGGKGSIVADIVLAMGSCLFMKLETLIKSFASFASCHSSSQQLKHGHQIVVKLCFFASDSS